MKKKCFYLYILFFKIIDSFKPFITKYFFSYKTKTNNIIKSLSGLLQNIPYINSINSIKNNFIENPNTIIETESHIDCYLNTEKCKIKMIIPGYMEHDPFLKSGVKKKN